MPHAGAGSTMSTAVTLNAIGVIRPVGGSTRSSGEMLTISGGVVSRTTTGNVSVAESPSGAVAEQVTTVVPSANVEPDAGAHDTGTKTPSCVADTLNTAAAPPGPVASTTMRFGSWIFGSGPLTTVTVNVAEPVL